MAAGDRTGGDSDAPLVRDDAATTMRMRWSRAD
jgi:hypothetical protein